MGFSGPVGDVRGQPLAGSAAPVLAAEARRQVTVEVEGLCGSERTTLHILLSAHAVAFNWVDRFGFASWAFKVSSQPRVFFQSAQV